MSSMRKKWFRIMILVPGVWAIWISAAGGQMQNNPPNYGQIQSAKFGELQGGFPQPDMIYAPFVFWFWDEPLDAGTYPAKARDMAREMMKQGLNPGYAHPRKSCFDIHGRPATMKPSPSLPKDQWLSGKWFDSFGAALESAEAGNGYLGYADEYMWPVGRAAGRVLKKHPELKKVSIQWKVMDMASGETLALPASFFTMAAQLDSDSVMPSGSKPMQGQWIWKADPASTACTIYLRKTFNLSREQVSTARIRIAVDNNYTLFINGTSVGQGTDWSKVGSYDVAALLRPGRNLIAVEGGGDGGLDALLCDLEIEQADGTQVSVVSDGEWEISKIANDGWNKSTLIDMAWDKVRVLGPAGMAPWSLPETMTPYMKSTVRSATLQRIGAGDSFTWTAPAQGRWRIYTFTKVTGADVNVLDRRLAKAFIELAHQPYADRLGERLGKSIPGAFCDTEGSFGNGDGIPWSDDLAQHYQTNTGRDILSWMPLMFDDDVEGISARARVDWFNAMSDLYSGFHAGINDWLAARGVYYIANLWEESLQWQAAMTGDHMKNQRGFSMPGTDCLQLNAYDVHHFKEAQAVAEFEGRRLMSEIMGAGNWKRFSPVTMKECVNSVVAWGVGHVVPHGIFMTRDLDGNPWTPDWYDENPLWSNMHLWSDFTKRASYVNSHGRAVPDVLLLNPQESVWALLGQTDKLWGPQIHNVAKLDQLYAPEVQNINTLYSEAMRTMTRYRIEYMVADAHYISQMKIEGDQLVRGDFHFKTIVMPPMAVMPLKEAKSVLDFAKAGGYVYTLGNLPSGSSENGLHDPKMAALMKELQAQPTVKACTQGLAAELDTKAPGLVSQIQFVSGEFPMLQSHRRIDDRDFFWVVNNSPEARQCVLQVAGARGAASVWDCETGTIRPVASEQQKSHSTVQLAFQPHEAYWLVFDPQQKASSKSVMALPEGRVLRELAASGWNLRIDPAAQPNLQHPVNIPKALTDAGGVDRDLTLWETWSDLPGNFSGLVDYTQTITLPYFKGELVLDLGTVNHVAEVWVNGKRIGAKLWPPHRFTTDAFRPGKNEIRIRVGNLINNNYNMPSPSGLLGPVVVKKPD